MVMMLLHATGAVPNITLHTRQFLQLNNLCNCRLSSDDFVLFVPDLGILGDTSNRMSFGDLPDDLLHSICDFLTPTEVYLLGEISPSKELYQSLIEKALSKNLCNVLKRGKTEFKCKDPLESFVDMVNTLPLPCGAVCIR